MSTIVWTNIQMEEVKIDTSVIEYKIIKTLKDIVNIIEVNMSIDSGEEEIFNDNFNNSMNSYNMADNTNIQMEKYKIAK